MSDAPVYILAVLAANVALSEWLAARTPLRHLGSALLVIVLTSVTANLGWIPTVGDGSPVYDGIFRYLAPLSIFWLLLQVNLRSIRRAGLPMILLFLLGSAGTLAGVLVGMWAIGGSAAFGDLHYALGGMFVATYVGGSINFNAVALHYGVAEHGPLFAGASVADSAMTTVWMAATVALPRLLRGKPTKPEAHAAAIGDAAHDDVEPVHAFDVAVLLALGAATLGASDFASERLAASTGVRLPSILVLTTVALALAQWRPVRALRGSRTLGWLGVMVFLAVIGALCDVGALSSMGALGYRLLAFVAIVVTVHGIVTFGVGAALHADPDMTAVASQANVGGGTSALALARSLGSRDLVLPAILIGSLGNGLGTYLGFLAAAWLR